MAKPGDTCGLISALAAWGPERTTWMKVFGMNSRDASSRAQSTGSRVARIPLSDGVIDLDHGQVERATSSARLTPNERQVLCYLAERRCEDVDRDALLREAVGIPGCSLSRAVDIVIARLRKKIEVDPENPRVLRTVHGRGYRLDIEDGREFEANNQDASIESHGLTIALDSSSVYRDGHWMADLTPIERRILRVLAEAPSRTLETSEFARTIFERADATASLASSIYRLRRKLGVPSIVESLRGIGYRLNADRVRLPSPEPTSVFSSVIRCAVDLLHLEDCVIYLRHGDHLRQRFAFDPESRRIRKPPEPLVLQIGRGIVGACASERRAVVVEDTHRDSRYVLDTIPARSEMCAPIVHKQQVVGVIDSECSRPAMYTQDDVTRLTRIAEIARDAFVRLAWL